MGQTGEQPGNESGVRLVHDLLGARGAIDRHAQTGIEGAEFRLEVGFESRHLRSQLLLVCGVEHDDGVRLARDGVAFAAARHFSDGQGQPACQDLKHAAEDANGVATAFVDVNAGVAALQAGDPQAIAGALAGVLPRHRAPGDRVDAARAADA